MIYIYIIVCLCIYVQTLCKWPHLASPRPIFSTFFKRSGSNRSVLIHRVDSPAEAEPAMGIPQKPWVFSKDIYTYLDHAGCVEWGIGISFSNKKWRFKMFKQWICRFRQDNSGWNDDIQWGYIGTRWCLSWESLSWFIQQVNKQPIGPIVCTFQDHLVSRGGTCFFDTVMNGISQW